MHHKKVTSIKKNPNPPFRRQFLQQNAPSLVAPVDSVHEQTAQILLIHAEISMIM